MRILSEFKPALLFLGKFLAVYLVGNILYGLWIESYGTKPDPLTRIVTGQTSDMLASFGFATEVADNPARPTVFILTEGKVVISVFEGCNGLNVMIVFTAFILAFSGPFRNSIWFIPAGLALIYLLNLGRVGALYWMARFQPHYFYYFHKYFFTASLYAVVFLLWWIWIYKINAAAKPKTD